MLGYDRLQLNKMAPNQGPSPLVKDCGKNMARAKRFRPEYAPPDVVAEGLIRVENKLYSVEELAKMHPGGPFFVRVSMLNYDIHSCDMYSDT